MSTGDDHLSRLREARDFAESTDRRTTKYVLGRQPDEDEDFQLGEAPLSQSILDIAQEILYDNLCAMLERVTEGPPRTVLDREYKSECDAGAAPPD